jgi:NADH-quinone oxidoreductase subunit G
VVQEERGPIFVATPADSKLDRDARRSYRGTPEAIARLGHAIAHALDANAPAARDLEDAERHWVAEVAGALRTARRPLVVSGTSAGSEALLAAAATVAWAAGVARREGPAELFLVVPEANTMGLALLGGASLDDALARIEADEVDTVIVVENDLEKRLGAARLDRARLGDCRLIVIDHLAHATAARADLVLPAATFAEGDGTLVNNEGRAQRFFQVMAPAGDVVESWRWIAALAGAAGRKPAALEHARATAAADGDDPWHAVSLDDVTAAVSASVPALARLREAAPRASFRLAGARLPRDPYRSSGRTAMHADRSVHEPRPPDDHDSPLAFSMEGYRGPSPAALVSQFWAPGWNSIQALNRFQQEIGGPLRGGDAGVRLIEPRGGPRPAYLGDVPAAAGETSPAESGTWRAVPLHHVFGSETLSAAAPAVAERSPAPYAGLGPDGAASLGVATGDLIELEIDGGWHALPVRLRTGLPAGVVGVPVEVAGLGPGCLPARLRIRRAAAEPRPAGSGRTPDDGGAGAAGARNESAGGGGAHPGGDEHA